MERNTLAKSGNTGELRVRQQSSGSSNTPAITAVALREAEDFGANPVQALQTLLRGRYVWACVLGLIGAAAGAFIAHRSVPDRFVSTGQIRIRPNVPRILYQSENNSVMPMFQSYVDSQASLIRSDAVIEQALMHPEWLALGNPTEVTSADTASFAGKLITRHPRGSELIQIEFTDTSPSVPAVAVKATIESYVELYGKRDAEQSAQTLGILDEHKTNYQADQKKLNEQMMEIAEQYGSQSLDPLVQYKTQELNEIRSELRKVKLGILTAESAIAPTTQPAGTATAAARPVPNELLAVHDPLMRAYIQQKVEIERMMAVAEQRVGENHPTMRDYRTRLATAEKNIETYGQLLRENSMISAGNGEPGTGGLVAADPEMALKRLRTQEHNLQTFYDAARQELAELGVKNIRMQGLRNESNEIQHRLDEIKKRTEQLNVESAVSGRVEVMDFGGRPVTPSGKRRTAWAGVGGVAGLIVGVGAVAFVGLLDRRRVLGMSDATGASTDRSRRFPILGAIPVLTNDASSDAQVEFTAQAVHRIRARLQIQRGVSDCRVIALTSPTSGDGKTSTTIALGLSFAAGRSRTLLIEGDVIGGGLTARLGTNVHEDLASILKSGGALSAERADLVRRRAAESGASIEEVLAESGWVAEVDLAGAKIMQKETKVGLIDALGGRPLAECVAPCHASGLHVLPLGNAQASDVAGLSPQAVRRLLKEAREQFDTVLIDTGPILGSLEAAVITAEADGVVLVVSRGNQRSSLEAAVAELDSLEANVIGAIYNRAHDGEMGPRGTSQTVSRMLHSRPAHPGKSIRSRAVGVTPPAAGKPGVGAGGKGAATAAGQKIGPIAAAVAAGAAAQPSSPKPGANGNGRH